MDFDSTLIINTLLIEPYNYISSMTDNMMVSIQDNTSKTYEIINDTIKTSYNTMIDYDYFIFDYTIFDNTIFDNTMSYFYNTYDIYLWFLFSTILIYYINKVFYSSSISNKNISNENVNNENVSNKNISNKNVSNKNNKFITKGLFTDSILEMNKNNKYIIENMKDKNNNKNNNFYALLRIKLKQPIELKKTKYKLNYTYKNDKNINNFTTNDMYMIIKFKYDITNYKQNDIDTNVNTNKISQVIINILNYLNAYTKDNYNNEDFIVLAISKENDTKYDEFYNGLININYELFNMKNITIDKYNKIGFTLLLPIYEVYNLFMDVFNDIIFESTSYKINYDNNEMFYDNTIYDV
jgi:hypothetical protein